MNQESQQDFPPQEIPTANSSHQSDSSTVPLLNLNGGGAFTVLQLPQSPTSTSSAIADPAIKPPLRKCSSCGFGGSAAKKRSHSPPPSSSSLSSLYYQPCSKRPAISSSNPSSSPDPTPPSSSERKRQRSPLPLRRSLSDFPIGAGGAYYYYQDSPKSNPAAAAAAASLKKNIPLSPSQIPLLDSFPVTTMVPGQKPLHRSPSNLSSSSEYYETPAVNTTPPRPRPPPCVRPQMFHHHHHQRCPNSKKLNRELKGKFEELMHLMGQLTSQQQQQQQQQDDDEDDDDANDGDDDASINRINKEKAEMMNLQSHDSKVWVKQTEEGGLILHFNCPCGDGYEVFLHGDKCYYRLA